MCDKIVPVLVINYKMVISVLVCDVTVISFLFIDSNGKKYQLIMCAFFNGRAQYNLIAFQYIESMGNPMKYVMKYSLVIYVRVH